MRQMFRRIRHILIKEFIKVWRDRKLRFFLFGPPLVQLIAYGYAINFDIKKVPTAIYDEDRTAERRRLISRFTSTDYFQVTHFADSPEEVRRLLDQGEITLALTLPWD